MLGFIAGVVVGFVGGYVLKKYNWFTTVEADIAKEFTSAKKEVANTVESAVSSNSAPVAANVVIANTLPVANT